MLQIFQSIFGIGEACGRYPESLIQSAIERVVDGTDPRLRGLPGYRKHLRAPVLHAIDHIVALVDNLPTPLPAKYGDDNPLTTLFASAKHMLDVFTNDAALCEFRSGQSGLAEQVTTLLMMEREEKHVLGMDMVDDILRRDVVQVVENFRAPRLVEPSASVEEARRQLKRRGFDHLLGLVLTRLSKVQREHADLNRQRTLLRRKLSALKHVGLGFEDEHESQSEPAALRAELEDVEGQLTALGIDNNVLQVHLDIICDMLATAEQQFWIEDIELPLDRMNVRRDAQDPSARKIRLHELHDPYGRQIVMLLVSISLDDLPPREDFFTAAKRYLG